LHPNTPRRYLLTQRAKKQVLFFSLFHLSRLPTSKRSPTKDLAAADPGRVLSVRAAKAKVLGAGASSGECASAGSASGDEHA